MAGDGRRFAGKSMQRGTGEAVSTFWFAGSRRTPWRGCAKLRRRGSAGVLDGGECCEAAVSHRVLRCTEKIQEEAKGARLDMGKDIEKERGCGGLHLGRKWRKPAAEMLNSGEEIREPGGTILFGV